jgi:hypothetical protein
LILFINIILIVIIIWVSYRETESSPIRNHFFSALIIKLSAGIFLGMIYFHHYKSGDTLVFDQAATYVVKSYGNSFRNFTEFLLNDASGDMVSVNPVLNEPRSAKYFNQAKYYNEGTCAVGLSVFPNLCFLDVWNFKRNYILVLHRDTY